MNCARRWPRSAAIPNWRNANADDLPDDVAHAMSRVESETRADDAARRGHAAARPARYRTRRWNMSRWICPGWSSTPSATPISPDRTTMVARPARRTRRRHRRRGAAASGAGAICSPMPASTPPPGTSVTTSLAPSDGRRRRADGRRRRPGYPGVAAARDLRALRTRRLVALAARGQHRARPGDRRGRRQSPRRRHRRAQRAGHDRVHRDSLPGDSQARHSAGQIRAHSRLGPKIVS